MSCRQSKESASAATIGKIRNAPYHSLFKKGVDAALAGSYSVSELYFHNVLQTSPIMGCTAR